MLLLFFILFVVLTIFRPLKDTEVKNKKVTIHLRSLNKG